MREEKKILARSALSRCFFFFIFQFLLNKIKQSLQRSSKQLYKKQGGKKKTKQLNSTRVLQLCTNTDCDIIQWNLAIRGRIQQNPPTTWQGNLAGPKLLINFFVFHRDTMLNPDTQGTFMAPRTSLQRNSPVQVKNPVSIFENVKQVYPFFCR